MTKGGLLISIPDVDGQPVAYETLEQGLTEIIKQKEDHPVELASALGIVPGLNGRKEASPFKKEGEAAYGP